MPARFIVLMVMPLLIVAVFVMAASSEEGQRGLPVRDGLALWLDADRIVQTGGQPAPTDETKVNKWPDASGRGRHLIQTDPDRRPRLVEAGGAFVVRFDGVDDHLRALDVGGELSAFTVFIVAAPHANPGGFSAFMAVNQKQGRDYETGFTIDMNWPLTATFDNLNVEGKGFGGAVNLRKGSSEFGQVHVIEAVASPLDKEIRTFLDGLPMGSRPFQPSTLRMDEITVGARYYTNGPGPQQVRGFLEGDVAEVLLYDRILSEGETNRVRAYLNARHQRLRETLPLAIRKNRLGEPLERIANPPPVQMLVPGFAVREIPVDLTNVNNVRYRPDGKLLALAYNGKAYLLSDTDGDGLEDKIKTFWNGEGKLVSPIGMALTPPGYALGQGFFVASKGKVSLIVDKDGDDRADEEIIVAKGWKELPHGVDALGVAVDKDGSVYFGLGAADFANAYQVDPQGKAHYDLTSDRGTIQRVSADFTKRETVCTGIRFSVSLAFNQRGDLFCTDQEGATWLPNGNPLDELLHVRPGRHYGFPPRHPKHLPKVIDEPSVFDYGPQHQSTCGLAFNDGPKPFGPAHWRGDAIVCGESRGKLYRTRLEYVASEGNDGWYLGQTQVISCLSALTVDACPSPQGDLVVATHSGPPDWGTGPNGKGKLYKISYVDRDHPQPVAIRASGPQEVRIDFDRALRPEHLHDLARQTKITYGPFVRAGDRFEVLKPPYQVVQMQERAPRFNLPVHGVALTNADRSLLLATGPMRDAVHYSVTLPGMGRPALEAKLPPRVLPQHPQIDLDFQLSGVQLDWQRSGPKGERWLETIPHLDTRAVDAWSADLGQRERIFGGLAAGQGVLRLRTRLDLLGMLRPAVQPGSKLDFELPPEEVNLTFASFAGMDSVPGRFRVVSPQLPGGELTSFVVKRQVSGQIASCHVVEATFRPVETTLIDLEVVMGENGEHFHYGPGTFTVDWHTKDDPRPRPLPFHRMLLPWAEKPAKGSLGSVASLKRDLPELVGASWGRGRHVFFSEEAACAKCHALRGEGGRIGPDLTNLVHRDFASVLRDVENPSYAINPDHVTYVLRLHDGRVLTGAIRTEGDKLHVGNEKGDVTTIARSDVDELKTSPKSIMPEDVAKVLGPEKLRDLLAFLLLEPPSMPLDSKLKPPAPRNRSEVHAVLAGAPNPPEKTRPLHVVLVAGPKDHGPGEHDYPAWQKAWSQLLPMAKDLTVANAWEWPKPEDFQKADVMVFYQHGTWTTERAKDVDAFLAKGGGLVYVHWAVDGNPDAPGFAQRIGLASRGGQIRFRHGPLELGFTPNNRHPIARNFAKVHFHDESYWKLTGDPTRINLLATSMEDGEPQPQFWTLEPSKGRVFVSILGHYSWTFDDPLFRILLLRGIAWAAKEPVDRFNDLAWPGARVAD